MNGPEHYRRAEALLDSCQLPGGPDIDEQHRPVELYSSVHEGEAGVDTCRNALAAAQVHATLALAAATAAPAVKDWLGDESKLGRAWTEVV